MFVYNDKTNLELAADGAVDKLGSGVHLHLAVHQGHGAGQGLLVLVPHGQHAGSVSSQAVGVVFPERENNISRLILSFQKKYLKSNL